MLASPCTEKPRKIFKKLDRCQIRADLSIEHFFIWLKHCYAVNFLFFGSHSAQFLSLRLDSAPTKSLGSKLPFRPILRPALCGHPLDWSGGPLNWLLGVIRTRSIPFASHFTAFFQKGNQFCTNELLTFKSQILKMKQKFKVCKHRFVDQGFFFTFKK